MPDANGRRARHRRCTRTRETPILDEDDAGTLTARLAGSRCRYFDRQPTRARARHVDCHGAKPRRDLRRQDQKGRRSHRDWDKSATEVWNHIRAFSPWPSAFAFVNAVAASSEQGAGDKRLQILRARPAQSDGRAAGTMFVKDDRLLVACASGAIEVTELQPEGQRAMSAAEFLLGRPSLPAVLT